MISGETEMAPLFRSPRNRFQAARLSRRGAPALVIPESHRELRDLLYCRTHSAAFKIKLQLVAWVISPAITSRTASLSGMR